MGLERTYFVFQGSVGALWWIGVFRSEGLRHATLGHLPLSIAWADVPLFVIASLLAAIGVKAAIWTALVWTMLVTALMVIYATVTQEAAWGAIGMAAALAGTSAASAWILLGRIPTDWLILGPFVFRTTPDAHGHLGRALRQLIAFWTAFLVVAPLALVAIEHRWRVDIAFPLPLRVAGGVFFLANSALGIASTLVMARLGEGTPLPAAMAKRLVIAGPYRFVRNPMAVAGIGQGVGVGFMLSSWIVVLYALAGSMMWNWAIRPHEEADLAHRFGREFEAYRERVSCWWPKRYAPDTP